MAEYRLRDGLYPFSMPVSYRTIAYVAKKNNSNAQIDYWDRKLGHISAERYFKLSEMVEEIPKIDRVSLNKFQYMPCMTSKAKRQLE